MKVFEFEQKLKNEYNEVNIIYKYRNGAFAIVTLKGRSCINEVKREKRVFYNSLNELVEKSEQYSKFAIFNTFLADTSKSNDASKWDVEQLFNIKFIKKELKITDQEIAKMFDYKNTNSYATSSAKKRIETGLVAFYELMRNNENVLKAKEKGTLFCECEIPKPIDPYHPTDKNLCRDCECYISK